eukprot:12490-Eustigmatos_ZCMA.PRE.1
MADVGLGGGEGAAMEVGDGVDGHVEQDAQGHAGANGEGSASAAAGAAAAAAAAVGASDGSFGTKQHHAHT